MIQSENKWEITLDHRKLKTPNGQVLAVTSEPLARAIAAEWDAQTETIAQPIMHLVRMLVFVYVNIVYETLPLTVNCDFLI